MSTCVKFFAGKVPGAAASARDMSDVFNSSGSTPLPPTSSNCSAAVTGVTVCSPAAGSTVGSPVHFVAAARSANPITSMRIYVDNVSQYHVSASSLDTSLGMSSGRHSIVVQAWDSTGAVFKSALTIQVP